MASTLADGRRVEAVTFVVDTDHVQYCGGLPLEEQAGIIARQSAGGARTPNTCTTPPRIWSSWAIHDPDLDWLARRVRDLTGTACTIGCWQSQHCALSCRARTIASGNVQMDQPDREAEPFFAQPVRQIILMLIVLALVGVWRLCRLSARRTGVPGQSRI